ncbi:ABC transporter ATP-binding protein [Ahrensia sp. R2A130]|uniref:ABC transporter ATP-binding protein n=1 Tax=Ahrensia sp. R2A130 TaxID=744979 RepID=UPI0001E0A455|nr:ABC transporter ATP-binding protein [Ahrensia sp. R2A130]EFL90669.1 ATP-binding protein of ABC transporter [Ahrensia sp. R2A130]
MDAFFRFFEAFGRPFERTDQGPPPAPGLGFLAHFARQTPWSFTAMLGLGGATALVEALLFIFVGLIVDMMNGGEASAIFTDNATTLIAMAVLVAVIRTIIATATAVVEEQIVVPEFFTLVRWQSHLAVSRQDVGFFDDEMAGRISQKVWQSGQASGDFMVSLLQIIWFISIFALTTLVVIAGLDWRLMLPVLLWLVLVAVIARVAVPRVRDRGRRMAEQTAVLTGRLVDGYGNIRTVKLHAAEAANDDYIRAAWDDVLVLLRRFTRAIAGMRIAFQAVSSTMLVVVAAMALWLFSLGELTAGSVAIALALCLRLNLLMGRLLGLLNGLFRNFGTVQNSAALISQRPTIVDAADASELVVRDAAVAFRKVDFAYEGASSVLENFDLAIAPGEKLGIVGPSGAGKTTLLNLLLRFNDLDAGAIEIDGQEIAKVSQTSLRSALGMVSQDTALLHRSVRDNIAFGMSDVSDEAVWDAARQAQADGFIEVLRDAKGRTGLDAHVGERGVKLSGGQRQRIALARVFLRNAPILLLDEATSALDSQVEAAINENLAELMRGKTVIAIAHRLSTIAHLDRLVVVEDGRIVESGTHDELLLTGGLYADLWARQSGGFLDI